MKIAVIQRDISDPVAAPAVPDADVVFAREGLAPVAAAAIGALAVLEGDACFDEDEIRKLAGEAPAALVLHPGSESDLQAEAVLELAIALSESVAALVIVVEDDGAEPGQPAHGGSAIVHAGEVLAEAGAGSEAIVAEIQLPVVRPLAHGTAVEVPPILLQRVAHHQGRHLAVDYPADV